MEEREDFMEDIAVDGIRIGRVYAKYGLNLAAHWVEYAGKLLGEVSEMLRDNATVLGGQRKAPEA